MTMLYVFIMNLIIDMLYQSPSKVQLKGTDGIPIFCLASGHSFDHQYNWSLGDKSIPGNSPVLWIASPGSYSCEISSGWYKCSSKTITVERQQRSRLCSKFTTQIICHKYIS